jgi:hypothetical protein
MCGGAGVREDGPVATGQDRSAPIGLGLSAELLARNEPVLAPRKRRQPRIHPPDSPPLPPPARLG